MNSSFKGDYMKYILPILCLLMVSISVQAKMQALPSSLRLVVLDQSKDIFREDRFAVQMLYFEGLLLGEIRCQQTLAAPKSFVRMRLGEKFDFNNLDNCLAAVKKIEIANAQRKAIGFIIQEEKTNANDGQVLDIVMNKFN